MDKKMKIAGAIGSAIVLVGAGMGLGFTLDNPEPVVKEVVKNVTVEVPVEVVKEVPVEVEKLVEVTVEDTETMEKLCDRLQYEDFKECVEEVEAEDAALKVALDFIESQDFLEELEDADIIKDEDRAWVDRVKDDFEDITVLKSNFDKERYSFEIKVKVEDDRRDDKVWVKTVIDVDGDEAEFDSVELDE